MAVVAGKTSTGTRTLETEPLAPIFMAAVVGFTGQLQFDISKPDGTPRKLLSVERLKKLSWKSSVGFK